MLPLPLEYLHSKDWGNIVYMEWKAKIIELTDHMKAYVSEPESAFWEAFWEAFCY